MCKTALVVAGLLAGLALAGAVASAESGGANVNCHPGIEGHPGSCVDPIGDVKGVAGPDITGVTEYEWGVIAFRVSFAKAPPLTHSMAFTDQLSVSLTATGTSTRRYLLTVSATDPKHQVLHRLPSGKSLTLPLADSAVSGKTVTLAVDLHAIGDPSIVRYRIEAARVMLDGTPGSSDDVPDKGTMVWRTWDALS